MTRERRDILSVPALDTFEFTIKTRDDHDICLRAYRRKGGSHLPLVLYMHGGVFVTGLLKTDDRSFILLAAEVDIRILSLEHRLTLESPFPVGFEDFWDVPKWSGIEDASSLLQIDPRNGVLVGGTSAGADFTTGFAHRYRDGRRTPNITGLIFWAGS